MATSVSRTQWEPSLQAIVNARGTVLASPLDDSGEPLAGGAWRIRLMSFDHKAFVIEAPGTADAVEQVFPGCRLEVLVVWPPHRWRCCATVAGLMRCVSEDKVLDVVSLNQPYEVQSAQRREFFRVSTAGMKLESAQLIPAVDRYEQVSGIASAESFTGNVVSVSGGGIAVTGPISLQRQIEQATYYECRFALPDGSPPIDCLVRVVRWQALKNDRMFIGCQFEPRDPVVVDRICRFTTWIQRKQLRRRRA
ncbi:MAG: hypothetical protein CMJ18_21620 [Phycisphaeraceae bacterium]|nr:hypothetical protein [Phycisphaeraceae bacterium]